MLLLIVQDSTLFSTKVSHFFNTLEFDNFLYSNFDRYYNALFFNNDSDSILTLFLTCLYAIVL
jgi:hypothetical protein